MISAKDLLEKNKTKNTVKKEIYTRLLTQMCRKIEVSHMLGKDRTLLRLPEYIFGYPVFNINNATIFIHRQLRRLGYRCSIIDSGRIYVAWGEKKVKITKEEAEALPTLSNLKKAANSIRKKYDQDSK